MTLNDQFHTDDLKQDLRRRSVHGGAFTVASQGAKFALSVASTMILARLLTPQDFGLVAMVVAATGFVTIFRDLGLATVCRLGRGLPMMAPAAGRAVDYVLLQSLIGSRHSREGSIGLSNRR